MDSIKKNLTNIVVIIGLIGSIGAGFTKYGELTTRLSEIEGRSSTDFSAEIAVLEEKVAKLSDEIENFLNESSRANISADSTFEILTDSELDYGFAISSKGTKTKEAELFAKESGADAMAISIGNVHLQTKNVLIFLV